MNFNSTEKEIIQKYLSKEILDWSDDELKPIRDKIKHTLKVFWQEQCCYCNRGMEDEFDMIIDIEHILPKSKFRDLTFNYMNLSLSCKRCNMKIKKEKIDFIIDILTAKIDFTDKTNYKFIHPNFDVYKANMHYVNATLDDKNLKSIF
jgi:uncharacterized protein (TIGR02646 family)